MYGQKAQGETDESRSDYATSTRQRDGRGRSPMTALTKNERWEIYRLCKRARGLYKAEKQGFVFIGEAQNMQEGVCRKALRNVEDFGNGVRQVQRGLHGHRRNGKLEFPGLLTRRIVSASGYLKGGRAPGGKGLATTYTINLDVLMTFIPEIDDDPPPKEMGATLGDTKSVTSSEKGVTLGDRVRTSSCSSSLGSSPSDESSCSKFRTAGERILGNSTRSERLNAENLVVVGDAPENQNRGQKESEPVSQEDRAERIIATSRARRLDRNQTDAEIYRDYRAVFDRLEREYQAWMNEPPKSRVAICGAHFDNPLQATAKHRHAAADLYRAIGRD